MSCKQNNPEAALVSLLAKSGTDRFVSFFGKSTTPLFGTEYEWVQQVTADVLSKGYGIIHGGYAGGMMQAVDEAAYAYLVAHDLPLERNIAVPQLAYDRSGWERVRYAIATPPAKDLFDRLRMMTVYSQLAIVAPLGGDGTLQEVITVYHQNLVSQYTYERIIPLVFMHTAGGTDWRQLMSTIHTCAQPDATLDQLDWLRFM